MLVLSRKTGESIRIGPDVEITVLAAHENRVRVGISAPTGISIRRAELVLDDAAKPPAWPSDACQASS